jgi:hypothetical protein
MSIVRASVQRSKGVVIVYVRSQYWEQSACPSLFDSLAALNI